MNLFDRKPLPAVFALVFAAAAGSALAVPSSYTGTNVHIDYDADTFVFESNGGSEGGSLGPLPLGPADYTISTAGDSATLSFGSSLYARASSYPSFNYDEAYGSYLAAFSFSALPGRSISGYRVTFTGTYDIESPGSVSVYGTGTSGASFGAGGFGTPWSTTTDIVGVSLPALAGSVQATAWVDSIEIPGVIVGYEQMPDFGDPDCIDPSSFECSYIDDLSNPIYNPPPHFESDLGLAGITIASLTIEAQTVAVPEPASYALMGLGIAALGWVVRRRRVA